MASLRITSYVIWSSLFSSLLENLSQVELSCSLGARIFTILNLLHAAEMSLSRLYIYHMVGLHFLVSSIYVVLKTHPYKLWTQESRRG